MFDRVLILFLSIGSGAAHEVRSVADLLEQGAVIRCSHFLTRADEVDALLDDPKHLADLRANARRLGRPHAALDIVRALQGRESGDSEVEQIPQRNLPCTNCC